MSATTPTPPRPPAPDAAGQHDSLEPGVPEVPTHEAEHFNPANDEMSNSLPETLEIFLSMVGVVNRTASGMSTPLDSVHPPPSEAHSEISSPENDESIFESSFDLTEERLQHVFQMFDTDKDGRISYESLRKVLEFHTAGSVSTPLLNEKSFQDLVKHLDLDGSGDISFLELSEGIRLLMLRALFHRPGGPRHDSAKLELIDYNITRLERRIVGDGSASSIRNAKPATSSPFFASSKHMSSTDFYFSPRPEWVMTRWINVACSSKAPSILTMKRLAIKYVLHPLALEDALSSERHRPKVEVFSSHYFLIIPIFSIESPPLLLTNGTSALDSPTNLLSKATRQLRRFCFGCRESFRRRLPPGTKDKAGTFDAQQSYGPPPVSQVRIQMVSIFVNVPTNDTIITFTTGGVEGSSDNHDADGPVPWQLRVQKELEKSYSKLRQYDAQYLVYALLDQAVDLVTPLVSTYREEIDRQRIWLRQDHYRQLQNIHSIQRELEKVGRKLKPFLRLLTHVIEDDAISPGATVYLRDVLDNLECADDELKLLLVECQALDTDADKSQSRQMDRTLYTLTVVSAVFLPAQFLTGVWGMNFVEMPELDESWGYPMFWGLTAAISVILCVSLNFGRLRY